MLLTTASKYNITLLQSVLQTFSLDATSS